LNPDTAPTVLLAATTRFVFPARLAMVLADAGFTVEAICPRVHFLAHTPAVKRLHRYGTLGGLSSLRSALAKAKPAIVIPCDDLALNHLHRLHDATPTSSDTGEIRAVVERSLGNPLSYPKVESRSRLLALVRQEGEAAVETTVISSSDILKDWLTANGFPAVLKTDGSSGGYGVRIVTSFEEAETARRKLATPPGLAMAIKRALVNRNRTFILPALERATPVVNAQRFIKGAEVTSTVTCWQGEVRAALTFEVLRAMYSGGPASVIRPVENEAINGTIRKTVARLGLSGICGFDFIIEKGTGIPRLIELNPRATQTAHIRLGPGHDTASALFSALTGKSAPAPDDEIKGDTIALFPQEWIRDPSGEYLKTAFHDVPWKEPALLEAIFASEGKRL